MDFFSSVAYSFEDFLLKVSSDSYFFVSFTIISLFFPKFYFSFFSNCSSFSLNLFSSSVICSCYRLSNSSSFFSFNEISSFSFST